MTDILVIGGADTGRAPMVALLLRLELDDLRPQVESAGVLGHDDDTWQAEARLALEHLGYAVPPHAARSLTAALVEAARVVVAIDYSIARVFAAQYNRSPLVLPELAGVAREVPDPFRMPLDAWLIYGRELMKLVKAAAPALRQALGQPGAVVAPPPAPQLAHPALGRLRTLVEGIAGLPEIIDWARARAAIRATLETIGAAAAPPDLRGAAVAMLLGVLGDGAAELTPRQLATLSQAADLLAAPMDSAQLSTLAGAVGAWQLSG